jgi:MFS family permease
VWVRFALGWFFSRASKRKASWILAPTGFCSSTRPSAISSRVLRAASFPFPFLRSQSSLETTIVGISWAVIAYQISQISFSLIFGRIGDIYGRHTLFGLGLTVSASLGCARGFSVRVLNALIVTEGNP